MTVHNFSAQYQHITVPIIFPLTSRAQKITTAQMLSMSWKEDPYYITLHFMSISMVVE